MTVPSVALNRISLQLSPSLSQEGPPRGLFLNRAKSLFIYTPANSSINHLLLRNIPTSSDGFTLLGSPIGPSAYCEAIVLKRVHKLEETLARFSDLQDSQMETALLRSCLALPSHLPPSSHRKGLRVFWQLNL